MKKKKTNNNSQTKVNYLDYVKSSFYSGKRRTIGFKGDLGLYTRFKPISKEMYGSTCRAFESFMASTIAAYDNKVNFSLGVNPINVDQYVVIERNIRSRRKLVVDETEVKHEVTHVQYVPEPGASIFDEVVAQWDLHPEIEWRTTWFNRAMKHPDLVSSKRIQQLYRKVTGK